MNTVSQPTQRPSHSSVSKILSCFHFSTRANALSNRPDSFIRRLFGAWSGLLGMCVQLFFVVRNFAVKGMSPETVLDIVSIALMSGALLLLCRFERASAAFRLGILTAIFICTYTVAFNLASQEDALLIFFVIPACLFFLLGFKESLIWLTPFLLGLTGFCVFPKWFGAPDIPAAFSQRYLPSLILFSGYSALVQYLSERSLEDLLNANTAIKNATDELKKLEGLVPVCSYCRKIMDEKGYWRQLEAFLQQHTNASVSSGLCESCAIKLGRTSDPDSFAVPTSLQSLFEWKNSFENIRRQFLVYGSLVGCALLWSFIVLDWAHGEQTKVWAQIGISVLLLSTVWLQYHSRHPQLASYLLVTVMFVLLVQPFFHADSIIFELFWTMLFPLVAAFLLNERAALLFILALLSFILSLLFFPHLFHVRNVSEQTQFFFPLTFVLVSTLSLAMEKLRRLHSQNLSEQLRTLEQTFQSIRTIKGLVPVCRECKAIRNDEGFWTSFDNYFRTHTDMVVSHGICESCLKKEAPEIYKEMLTEQKRSPGGL
ncbi:MAG: hypothetical protein JXX14_11535 [Deltaproteobacteria bacterium]|nr:hypothetical protein [Deltaproteobacteria bacterium]